MRRDWHDRVSRIRSVRFADTVRARYRLRRKPYSVLVRAGFDPESGTFWMSRGQETENALSSLCEAIAAQLVFGPRARPVELLALERALRLEIDDPSYGPRTRATSPSKDGKAFVEDVALDADLEGDNEDLEPGEARAGHSPFRPDALRNVPKPGPIPSSLSVEADHRPRRTGRQGANERKEDNRSSPKLETVHVENLKENQYASHCQMCLCRRSPEVLAPADSYIEWEEVRRRVVEAHHVDLKSAGGARHAGNLILLCKFHHENYGRRLTRAAVTSALRKENEGKTIRFGGNCEGSDVEGQVTKIVIPDTGEVVELFFTNDHALYWRARDPSLADGAHVE